MKKCCRCKKDKPETEFYFNTLKGELMLVCKQCEIQRVTKRYHDKDVLNNYHKTVWGRKKWNEASRRARKKFPEKWEARAKLRYAVSKGLIQKLNCEVCGNIKVQAHHHLGYADELWREVQWLCQKHHTKQHFTNL